METIAFSTDFNSIGSFLVHFVCGTVAGGLFVLLYWQWPARLPSTLFAVERPRPAVKLAVGVFLAPTFLFAIWAYCSYLTPFFAARLSSQNIVFEYRFPERAVSVPRSQVESVSTDLDSEKERVPVVVHTKDGRRFESAPVKYQRFEQLKRLLQRAP